MSKGRITTLALLIWCFMKSTHVSGVRNITYGISRHVRSIGFPEGSNTGILFALGIPIDIPDLSISMAFYFEANYGLPYEWNSSYFYEQDYYTKRSLSRQLVYRILVNKMERYNRIPRTYQIISFIEHIPVSRLSKLLTVKILPRRVLDNRITAPSLGYSGLDCLLRMICEAGRYSLSGNGVLGDILQIILTPSTSRSENLPDEIIEAEHEQHCDQRYKKCSINPLELISYYISSN